MTTDWVTFRHPLGLSLSHPPGWRIVHAQDALQIVPDDLDQSSEFILARAIAAPVARIDDPSVIAYMDDSIRRVLPGLRRTSDPSVASSSAGEGMVLDYAGKLGDERAGAAVVYSVLVDGSAVSLTAIATEAQMARRKPLLADVFATFAVGSQAAGADGAQAQIDGNLIGTWRQKRARHNVDGQGGGTFDSSSTTYLLELNGTYAARHKSFINISLPGGGGGGSQSVTDSAATWSANGEFLALRSEEGVVVFAGTYKVFGNGIELLPADGGNMVLLERG